MTRTRRTLAVTAAAALALTLSGCSDEAKNAVNDAASAVASDAASRASSAAAEATSKAGSAVAEATSKAGSAAAEARDSLAAQQPGTVRFAGDKVCVELTDGRTGELVVTGDTYTVSTVGGKTVATFQSGQQVDDGQRIRLQGGDVTDATTPCGTVVVSTSTFPAVIR